MFHVTIYVFSIKLLEATGFMCIIKKKKQLATDYPYEYISYSYTIFKLKKIINKSFTSFMIHALLITSLCMQVEIIAYSTAWGGYF